MARARIKTERGREVADPTELVMVMIAKVERCESVVLLDWSVVWSFRLPTGERGCPLVVGCW